MAGVVFKTKFVGSGAKAFKSYIDYIDRKEAIKTPEDKEYNLFHEYMGNPKKSPGLFSRDRDFLNKDEKQELKDIFAAAQEKGSLMFQSLFSFEKEWLIACGLFDEENGLNEKKLKEYTRAAMNKLFESEGMQGWSWSAAIHHNTDHYHVHIAFVDPAPSWEEGKGRCYRNQNGELAQRGKLKGSSIAKTKSTFVNLALDSQKTNEYLNHIVRNKIIAGKKERQMEKDVILRREFKHLLQSLPDDMRLWFYKMNAISPYQSQIDSLSEKFINAYFKSDFEEFKKTVDDMSKKYKTAYGGSKEADHFTKSKMDDLYYRLGNAILSECRACENKRREDLRNKYQNRRETAERNYTKAQLHNSMIRLRRALQKDMQSLKNQAAYERFTKNNEHDQSLGS